MTNNPPALKLKAPEPKESEIQSAILSYLRVDKRVAYFYRNNVVVGKFAKGRPVRSCPNGISDIIGVLNNGKFLAVEVKTRKGKPSVEQLEFLRAVNRAGGIGIIARSVDGVKAALDALY